MSHIFSVKFLLICYKWSTHIYCFRGKASQNFDQCFVHLFCGSLEEFTTTGNKQRVPFMTKRTVHKSLKITHERLIGTDQA